jgi:hypothetical protein
LSQPSKTLAPPRSSLRECACAPPLATLLSFQLDIVTTS